MHALIKFLFKERKDKNPINQNLLLKSIVFFVIVSFAQTEIL